MINRHLFEYILNPMFGVFTSGQFLTVTKLGTPVDGPLASVVAWRPNEGSPTSQSNAVSKEGCRDIITLMGRGFQHCPGVSPDIVANGATCDQYHCNNQSPCFHRYIPKYDIIYMSVYKQQSL